MFAAIAVLALLALSIVLYTKRYDPVARLYGSALCLATTGHCAHLNVLLLPLPASIPRRCRTRKAVALTKMLRTVIGVGQKAVTAVLQARDVALQGTLPVTAPLCRPRALIQISERTYTCAVGEVGISPLLWSSSSLDKIESTESPAVLITSPSGRSISPRARWSEGEFTYPAHDADKLHDGWQSQGEFEEEQEEEDDELEKLEEDRVRLAEGTLTIIVEAPWAAPESQAAMWTLEKDITLAKFYETLNEDFGVTIWLAHTGEFSIYNIWTEEGFEEWKLRRYEAGPDFAILAKSPEQIAEEEAEVDEVDADAEEADESDAEEEVESDAEEAFASVEEDMLTNESLSEAETMLDDGELAYEEHKDVD